MTNTILRLAAVVLVFLCGTVSSGAETKQDRLERLRSYGFLITPGGIGDADIRIVVPYDCRAGMNEIDDLRDFCLKYSPRSEIVFFGPIVVEEDLRLFRSLLPQSHTRHMSAVRLGFVYRTTHDDRRSRVLRIDNVSTFAKRLGLRVGDVIVGIGDFRWPESHSQDFYQYAMTRQIPGQQSLIYVQREGAEIALPVRWSESGPSKLLTKSMANNAMNRSRGVTVLDN